MDLAVVNKRKKQSEMIDIPKNDRKVSAYEKNLICTVCGALATGFNFSVITCMCCKAFFRRNALFGLQPLQCRYLTETCDINMKSRRDCSYCRLKKCFQVGMKKESILTDDLKRIKREKILANRQMTLSLIHPIDSLTIKNKSQLKSIESTYLSNIYNVYEEYCRLPLLTFEKNEHEMLCQQPIKSRFKLQHYFEYYEKAESTLINFFQRIPEFKQFSNDQQLVLSKHNIRFLVRINIIETMSAQLPVWPAIDLLLETIFGESVMKPLNIILHEFKEQINDPICIRLLLVIFLFSTYQTYNGHTDTLHIYRIQAKYTELLWLYLKQRYSEFIACQKLLIIAHHCVRLQTIGHLADIKRQEIQTKKFFLSLE